LAAAASALPAFLARADEQRKPVFWEVATPSRNSLGRRPVHKSTKLTHDFRLIFACRTYDVARPQKTGASPKINPIHVAAREHFVPPPACVAINPAHSFRLNHKGAQNIPADVVTKLTSTIRK
jgi:hypothetical protein